MQQRMNSLPLLAGLAAVVLLALAPTLAHADGAVSPVATYDGHLDETKQQAIIIFDGQRRGPSMEEMILSIATDVNVQRFAWVIPFPTQPKVTRSEPRLFAELYNYVALRRHAVLARRESHTMSATKSFDAKGPDVSVLSRKTVGSYDVAVVRENVRGTLNGWLKKEGYRPLRNSRSVLEYYRRKGYVFACIKVTRQAQQGSVKADLHPLRFVFRTGGRDGIYFPMLLTGLQRKPFDVELYVFARSWLNAGLNVYGHERRGFRVRWRDRDSPDCKPNAGKRWDLPEEDPYLRSFAGRLETVAKHFRRYHPGKRYYLTQLAGGFTPTMIRGWPDDLWLFPHYNDRSFVPYDARVGGVAHETYRHVDYYGEYLPGHYTWWIVVPILFLIFAGATLIWWLRRRRFQKRLRI